ncbi:MAG: hypothetical protein QM773_18480 [Hyphomonadaceae bacterium]
MMRLSRILAVSTLFAISAAGAFAQPPEAGPASASTEATCPRGRLSIYYASGEAAASQPAEALIGLISEHALACKADGLDLIARIDSRVDGDGALSLALKRLNDVADELVARGVPADGIRVAAQAASSPAAPNINQIDVIFRKADPADEVVAPVGSATRTAPSDSI